MKGFLFDENVPRRIRFTPSLPIVHATQLGESCIDSHLWTYARENALVIVTKDSDFSNRIMVEAAPPWIVHLRFGNLQKNEFHDFLSRIWPNIEALLPHNKLINVYLDHIEAAQG